MTWDKVLEYGYGLLDLSPDQFYEMEVGDFFDMVESKLSFNLQKQDSELEWTSWFVANLMMTSGNMKKGTKAQKLAHGLYLPIEERKKKAEEKTQSMTVVGQEVVKNKQEELMSRFNLQE